MWISQATLDGLQANIAARDERMAATARERCEQLRSVLALLVDDARFQALPVRHPFRSEHCLSSALGMYSQGASAVLEWIALSGATRALLRQDVALSWLVCNRPEMLANMRHLLVQG